MPLIFSNIFLAGMQGVEPRIFRTKTGCLTIWPHPIGIVVHILGDQNESLPPPNSAQLVYEKIGD